MKTGDIEFETLKTELEAYRVESETPETEPEASRVEFETLKTELEDSRAESETLETEPEASRGESKTPRMESATSGTESETFAAEFETLGWKRKKFFGRFDEFGEGLVSCGHPMVPYPSAFARTFPTVTLVEAVNQAFEDEPPTSEEKELLQGIRNTQRKQLLKLEGYPL